MTHVHHQEWFDLEFKVLFVIWLHATFLTEKFVIFVGEHGESVQYGRVEFKNFLILSKMLIYWQTHVMFDSRAPMSDLYHEVSWYIFKLPLCSLEIHHFGMKTPYMHIYAVFDFYFRCTCLMATQISNRKSRSRSGLSLELELSQQLNKINKPFEERLFKSYFGMKNSRQSDNEIKKMCIRCSLLYNVASMDNFA